MDDISVLMRVLTHGDIRGFGGSIQLQTVQHAILVRHCTIEQSREINIKVNKAVKRAVIAYCKAHKLSLHLYTDFPESKPG